MVSGRRLLLTLGLWAVLAVVVIGGTVLASRFVVRWWAAGHLADLSALLLVEAYLTLLAALLIAFGPAGLRDQLRFRFTSFVDLVLALCAWLAAIFVGGIVAVALSPLIGEAPSNTAAVLGQSFDGPFVAMVVVTLCLLVPFCEELLFRGVLYGWLARYLPVPVSVVVTAAVFAGAHLLPLLFPILFVLGLALTTVRAWTGSTLNSFAMHMTQNTVATVAFYTLLSRGH